MKTPFLWLVLLFALFLSACEKEEITVEEEKQKAQPPGIDWINKLKIHSDKVEITWYMTDTVTTAFELEKKVGNSDYRVIARIDGAAVSRSVYAYSYTDTNPEKFKVINYRLRSFSDTDASAYTTIHPMVIGEITKRGDYSNSTFDSQLIRTADGGAMIIGGEQYWVKALSNTYMPSTGEWLPGPAMAQERRSYKTALLEDGKIMVTGGAYSDNHFTSTEIYDPVSKTFSPGPAMNFTHTNHTMTTLSDGNILVVGGYRSNSVFSNKCEVYYPKEKVWKEIASLHTARAGHRTFQLKNGDILVIGGVSRDVEGHPTGSCELYSFKTNSWVEVGQLLSIRRNFAAFELDDHNILVTGGYYWGSNQIELYNTGTLTSSTQPKSLFDYQTTKSIDLGNGLVLLYGAVLTGFQQNGPLNLQVYDKRTRQWYLTNLLPLNDKAPFDWGANGTLLSTSEALFTNAGKSLTFRLKLEE